jgi:hypothetical protein
MPEPPGVGARGWVSTTALFGILGAEKRGFAGEFEHRSRENSQNLPPVSKGGLIRVVFGYFSSKYSL